MNRSEARKKPPAKPGMASINMSRKSSHSFGNRSVRTIGGGSRNNLFASSSRKSVVIDSTRQDKSQTKPPVQVFDDMGQDVTPRSLLQVDPAVKRNQSNTLFAAGESIATPSEITSQSFYAASSASIYGGFSRSVFGSSVSGRSSPESISEDLTEPSSFHDKFSSGLGNIQTRPTFVKEELTEADLDKTVHLMLTETDTIWLLDFPGTCVAQDSDGAEAVAEKNQKYDELLKTRAGNDGYVDRSMQTFNNGPKNKEVQAMRVDLHDAGCTATVWDMYDTYNANLTGEEVDKEEGDEYVESLSRPVSGEKTSSTHDDTESVGSAVRPTSGTSGSISESRASMFTFRSSSVEEEGGRGESEGMTGKEAEDQLALMAERILKSENMQKDLFVVERAIALNTYQPRQARYRGLRVVPDIDAERPEEEEASSAAVSLLGPTLSKLWTYSCALTKGRNISCTAWNKLNPDILAVGYGEFAFSEQKGSGIACCWSIKNPEYPERIYNLNSGVTALDFSAAHPNLLAVGMYDGTISIYNVRNASDSPALDSSDNQGKHAAPVWQVSWVDRDQGTGEERDEILISISADGRVTKWSIRKGFECADLMKLKRINVARHSKAGGGAAKKSDALISRFAAGFCFDVQPSDSNIYLAGTEEGHIHKCSCSYNEQYLESYHGHTGPVYRLQWSPFLSNAFLSCSADWSIRLWNQNKPQPVMTFLSSTKSVNDVCWSPSSATLFACVNDKAIEIWDLNVNTLDPLISHVPVQDVKLSTVKFAVNTEIQTILVGDSEGQVTVYQLRGFASGSTAQTQVLTKLISPPSNSSSSPPSKAHQEEKSGDGAPQS